MRLACVLVAAAVLAACAAPPTPPSPPAPNPVAPSTDVYVYRLSRLLPLGSRLINITNRIGYDNQPAWVGSDLYYTSVRDGQADIWRYRDGRHEQVTATAESEYSAALTPDGLGITVVRVERDSTQRLWRFPLGGGAPSVILPDVKPVGYFAWLDSAYVALFVLGEPNTLRVANRVTGDVRVVATNIGRSLQRVPKGRKASFVRRVGDRWRLDVVDPAARSDGSLRVDTLATLPDSAEYVVWRSDTEVYTAGGSRIYRMRLPQRRWEQVADLGGDGIRRITRLALSQDGGQLAIVADDARPAP